MWRTSYNRNGQKAAFVGRNTGIVIETHEAQLYAIHLYCVRHFHLSRVQLSKMEANAEVNKDQVAKLEEAIKASK